MEAVAQELRDWPTTGGRISNSSSGGGSRRGGVSRRRPPSAARVVGAVVRGAITFVFAAAGAALGAVTGALIGLATESGLVRGAGVGVISGAVVSMEVVDSSVAIWRSRDSGGGGIWSVLYVLDVIWSLLTGRLVREKVDPAVQSAVESQMNAADSFSFSSSPFGGGMAAPRSSLAVADMFDTTSPSSFSAAAATGMPAADIAALPATTIVAEEDSDAAGGCFCCSVCLQDLEAGDAARRLPGCGHAFHLPCIDAWLLCRASCPLCRRALV